MERGYPNPSRTGMRFDFSSPLGMGRVTYKYMGEEYGDMEDKIHPHPCPLPCIKNIINLNSLLWFINATICLKINYVDGKK